MLINIDNGVFEANDLKILSKFGGYITLTEDWAGGIVQSIDWVKRKGTNGKIEPFPQLRAEERFTFQKSIAPLAYDHSNRKLFPYATNLHWKNQKLFAKC